MRKGLQLGIGWRAVGLVAAVLVAADCAAPERASLDARLAGAVSAVVAPQVTIDTTRDGLRDGSRAGQAGGSGHDRADSARAAEPRDGVLGLRSDDADLLGMPRARVVAASLVQPELTVAAGPDSPWPLVIFSGIPEDPVAHDQPVLVTWSETRSPMAVATRTLITEQAPFVDGACSAWARISAAPAPGSHVAAAGLLEPGRCYRFIIRLTTDELAVSEQVSPPLWVAAPPPPFFRFDLLREGMYSPQQTWTWCTAASVQMMRNMVKDVRDTSYATQLAVINYEHAHDRYPTNVAGSDPQGMVAALSEFGVGTYRWTRGTSSDATLREAAWVMRVTRKPASLFVNWGSHAWVMSGFTATADPLVDDGWRLTGVYVEGPLYPRQALKRGFYDPPPDQWYSVETMRQVMLPYIETTAPSTSIWQRTIVAVVPEPS